MKIFIVMDVEAACFDREDKNKPVGFRNEIIEIGAVKCDEHGNILGEFNSFLKPKKYTIISEFCNTLTTIKQSDIDLAPDAKIVL